MSRYRYDRKPGVVARTVSALGPKALIIWMMMFFIAFAMSSALTRIVANLDLLLVVSAAALALTLGWIFAMLPMSGGLAGALGTVFGIEFLLIRVGRLGDEILQVLRAIGIFLWQLTLWYWTEEPPVWRPVVDRYVDLWSDMLTLLDRTFGWLSGLMAGDSPVDLVGTALVWGMGIWLLMLFAGFVVRRYRRPLLAITPAGVLLGFVLSFTNASPYVFLPILGITLILLALMREMDREDRWVRRHIDFSQGLWSDIAMVATGISIALVIAAAVAPSISAQRIADWVREMTDSEEQTPTERVAEGLGLEQAPDPQPREPEPLTAVESTGLPRRHLIGSGPELTRQIVMLIDTGELPPIPEAIQTFDAPRHYWRSITYDRYLGRGWATSNTEESDYTAGEMAVNPNVNNMVSMQQTVRVIGDNTRGMVHVDGALVSVDSDYMVAWRPPGEIFAATTPAREYTAESLLPLITADDLRAASTDYPDWIAQRYLRLPDSVPQRVISLARDLTATEPTAYDRVIAIERYLRQFPYDLDVPTPGTGSDIADYFLFELQRGYCDYYATAMVVLARASGLPARLVVGYATGSYDPMNARYIVTEADAHAWPEVYFPDYGWVEFEPTGGRSPINREGSTAQEGDPFIWPEGETPPAPPEPAPEPWFPRIVLGLWVMGVIASVLLIIVLVTSFDTLRLWLSTPERMLSLIFRRLRRRHATRLHVPLSEGATPDEMVGAFERRFAAMAKGREQFAVDTLDLAVYEIRDLRDIYIQTWYRPGARIAPELRRTAIWTWWRLRWRLWVAWLWRGGRQDVAESPVPRRPERALP